MLRSSVDDPPVLETPPHGAARRSITLQQYLEIAAIALAALLFATIVHVSTQAYIAFGLCGSFVGHVYLRQDWREWLAAALIGAAYALIYRLVGAPFGTYVGAALGTMGAFAGIGSLVFLGVKAVLSCPSDRSAYIDAIVAAGIVPALATLSIFSVSIAADLTPRTYDYSVYAFDRTLGFEPSFQVGQLFAAHPALFTVCACAYNGMPLFLATFIVVWHARGLRTHFDFRMAAVSLGVLGFLLYQVCPVSGPIYRFESLFPSSPPAVLPAFADPTFLKTAIRNGMPSLHVGWVLLCVCNTRTFGILPRIFAPVFLLLTVLATLGSGEHYFIDLVVVVPVCLILQAVWSRGVDLTSRYRLLSILTGATMTVLWLLALRFGFALRSPSIAVSWFAVLSTIAVCSWLQYMLARTAVANHS
ncbi:MAG: phosphatase PAP2 family protein [Bryobacteraceae bacterium]